MRHARGIRPHGRRPDGTTAASFTVFVPLARHRRASWPGWSGGPGNLTPAPTEQFQQQYGERRAAASRLGQCCHLSRCFERNVGILAPDLTSQAHVSALGLFLIDQSGRCTHLQAGCVSAGVIHQAP